MTTPAAPTPPPAQQPPPPTRPWWSRTWLIVVLGLLVITIPVALVLLWLRRDWSPARRALVTAGAVAYVVVLAAISPPPKDEPHGVARPVPVAPSAPATASPTVPPPVSPTTTAAPPAGAPSTAPTPSPTTVPSVAPPPESRTGSVSIPPQPAGTCAKHTVGTCGWAVGLTPASPQQMAVCNDGAPSYATEFRGTCADNGGVRYWFK